MKYYLNGFGYDSWMDFKYSIMGIYLSKYGGVFVLISSFLGVFRTLLLDHVGLDITVFVAFVVLIIAEFQTGIKVSVSKRGERFKSRKFGRMLLKIGTYILIITLLNAFAKSIKTPQIFEFNINPFVWLYYTVFIAIVFQLLVSWLENLGSLGYKETKTIAGFILRKLNQWFEFDGSKNNGNL